MALPTLSAATSLIWLPLPSKETHTPRRTFRYGREDWVKVQELASKLGISSSDLIRAALTAYVFEHGKDAADE